VLNARRWPPIGNKGSSDQTPITYDCEIDTFATYTDLEGLSIYTFTLMMRTCRTDFAPPIEKTVSFLRADPKRQREEAYFERRAHLDPEKIDRAIANTDSI
jgi:hypothetical protein